jgi:4'-phosphopantetheinyl transferase EntD
MKFSCIEFDGIKVWLTHDESKELERYLVPAQRIFAESTKLEKRRQEFIKSRALLNFATDSRAEFNLPASGPSQHGGYFVSISHKDNVAVVATSKTYDLLGVDMERLQVTSPPIRHKVLTPLESQKFSEDHLPTLSAFSFKESVYKALNLTYPKVKYFHQCEILTWEQGVIEASVTFMPETSSVDQSTAIQEASAEDSSTSPTTLSLSGKVWNHEYPTARYVVSVAYMLKK